MVQVEYKDYVIESAKRFPSLKIIRCKGSGTVAATLGGFFTSIPSAKEKIDVFLTEKLKVESDAKAKPKPTSQSVQPGSDN